MNLPVLPDNPGEVASAELVSLCRAIYEARDAIVPGASLDAAMEGLRRAKAIEAYSAGRTAKDEARRAARVLETAVGEALGPGEQGKRTDLQPFSREKEVGLKDADASRFRVQVFSSGKAGPIEPCTLEQLCVRIRNWRERAERRKTRPSKRAAA